jgi:hypothetical protein
MTPLGLAIAHGTKIALLVVIVGILARRRQRECRSFLVYLAVIAICNTLVSFWPETFYFESFYIRKQVAYDILKLIIALELAYAAFRSFPGALPAVRKVVLGVLVVSTVFIADSAAVATAQLPWHRPVVMGTLWLYTAIAALVLWFRIPVTNWHRAILMGFAPYLAFFTFLGGFLARNGWDALPLFNAIEPPAYLLMMSFWGVAAWRREEEYAVAPEVAARLRLEAV